MLKLHLTRNNDAKGVFLELPAYPADMGSAYVMLDVISDDPTSTRIVGAVSTVSSIGQYLKDIDINNRFQLKMLNMLAEKIRRLSPEDAQRFAGALDIEATNGLDDIFAISRSLDSYEFYPDVYSERELGVYLAENGDIEIDERALPYVDYARVGSEYEANHSGAYVDEGYVVKKEDAPPLTVDADRPQIYKLRLYSTYIGDTQPGTYRLSLPASEIRLEKAKEDMRIKDLAECMITEYECTIPYIKDLIPDWGISVEGFNEVAREIELLLQRDGELLKLCAVLDVERPETLDVAVSIIHNLDNYERFMGSPSDYAYHVLDALEKQGIKEISDIKSFMDLDAYGRWRMEADGLRQTGFGKVRRLDEPFPAQDNEMSMQME